MLTHRFCLLDILTFSQHFGGWQLDHHGTVVNSIAYDQEPLELSGEYYGKHLHLLWIMVVIIDERITKEDKVIIFL